MSGPEQTPGRPVLIPAGPASGRLEPGTAIATDEACRFGVISSPFENPAPEAEEAFLRAQVSKWTGFGEPDFDLSPAGGGVWAFEAFPHGFLEEEAEKQNFSRVYGAQALAAGWLCRRSGRDGSGLVALLAGRRGHHVFEISGGILASYLLAPPEIAAGEARRRAENLAGRNDTPTVLLLGDDISAVQGPESCSGEGYAVECLGIPENGAACSLEALAMDWLARPGPGGLGLNAFDRLVESASPGPWKSGRVRASLAAALVMTVLNLGAIVHEIMPGTPFRKPPSEIVALNSAARGVLAESGLAAKGSPGSPSGARTSSKGSGARGTRPDSSVPSRRRGYLYSSLRALAGALPDSAAVTEASLARGDAPGAIVSGWVAKNGVESLGSVLEGLGWTVGSLGLGERGVWVFSASTVDFPADFPAEVKR